MTTAPHTQGRLVVKGGFSIYTKDDGIPIADASIHNTHAQSEADARRLAACWNVCEGFTTEHLENILMLGDTMLSRFQARNEQETEHLSEIGILRDHLRACVDGWTKGNDVVGPMHAAIKLLGMEQTPALPVESPPPSPDMFRAYCHPDCTEADREYKTPADKAMLGAYICRKCGFDMPF